MHWNLLMIVLTITMLLNTISAIITVFHRPRTISTTLAWLLVLLLLPVFGFLLYAFLGRGLAQEKLFSISRIDHVGLTQTKKILSRDLQRDARLTPEDTTHKADGLIRYYDTLEDTPVTRHNRVKVVTEGHAKFEALFADIQQATSSIHVEYYAIFKDHIGQQLLDLLVQKAQSGCEVRVLYDPWGGSANKRWFHPLVAAGGRVLPFVTSREPIRKTRLNYHLHRKIVVIDGAIGWTGGFNVGDQYLGRSKKFGYWRDTHVRIEGTGALSLQERFTMDWNASVRNATELIDFQKKYFPDPVAIATGHSAVQIVSDGPDRNLDILKGGMLKMIMMAKKSIWIQTPYFVPDETIIDALGAAALSGIDVRVMIPPMPDHPFIYRATQYYANLMTPLGIKIYVYRKGFMHAKTVVVDDVVASVGSMNQDFRSYSLNFECNAVIYDRDICQQLTTIFEHDMTVSTLLTSKIIVQQSRWLRFKQYFSRLLSPIL